VDPADPRFELGRVFAKMFFGIIAIGISIAFVLLPPGDSDPQELFLGPKKYSQMSSIKPYRTYFLDISC
jgi:hypothetical protein